MSLYCCIIAGGRGERFWPKSRKDTPKHFLPIVGDKSMISQTVDRAASVCGMDHLFIITNKEQKLQCEQVCQGIKVNHIIGEPESRDTAAAIALATTIVKSKDPYATIAILPADHTIKDVKAYHKALGWASELAKTSQKLVTIGIPPHFPSTSYGYILKGSSLKNTDLPTYEVQKFVEKPNAETATAYLASGEYFWNAGMFISTVSNLESLFKKHAPEYYAFIQNVSSMATDEAEFLQSITKHYSKLPKISFDYAIVEKTTDILTIEAPFDWDDVGEWTSLERHHAGDLQGNIIQGQAILEDCKNNLIINSDGHLTALIGVEDLVVVQTHDATLICPKSRATEIKKLIKQIEQDNSLACLL